MSMTFQEKTICLDETQGIIGTVLARSRDYRMFICSVFDGSLAKKKGIQKGDVLTQINGIDIQKCKFSTMSTFSSIIASAEKPVWLTFVTPITPPVPIDRMTVQMQIPLQKIHVTPGMTRSALENQVDVVYEKLAISSSKTIKKI